MQGMAPGGMAMPAHPGAASPYGGPAGANIITTELIQKYLDENKQLILAILDNQNLGKLNECTQYQNRLQQNLMYLAAIADAQPQLPSPAQPAASPAVQPQQYPPPQQAGIPQQSPVVGPPAPGPPPPQQQPVHYQAVPPQQFQEMPVQIPQPAQPGFDGAGQQAMAPEHAAPYHVAPAEAAPPGGVMHQDAVYAAPEGQPAQHMEIQQHAQPQDQPGLAPEGAAQGEHQLPA